MYTSSSQMFSKEFEGRAMQAINKAIESYKGYEAKTFAASTKMSEHEAGEVMRYGHRWKQADQVYHAMIMRFGQKMFQERGPGFMTQEEATSIEKMHLNADYLFAISACEGIAGAANCDHWYMFEKVWD